MSPVFDHSTGKCTKRSCLRNVTLARPTTFLHLPTISEFSFETNAPPVGGYITSDRLSATAGEDMVLLQGTSWTDDYDDLPTAYSFGFAHGWYEILIVSR